MKRFKYCLLFLLVLCAELLLAQDGTLDPTFGNNGVATVAFAGKNARGQSLVVLDDGSMVIAVNTDVSQWGGLTNRGFTFLKLQANGQPDLSFGTIGHLTFSSSTNAITYAFSLLKQPDGKILISCKIDGTAQLLRIDSNGQLDTSFGTGGSISTAVYALGLQSDGKIIVGGHYFDGFSNFYSFSRFNSNGTLDPTFGSNGTAITDITPFRFDLCNAITIQPDNKIIAAGTSYDHATQRNAVVVRFTENGFPDSSFANNGVAMTPIGPAPGYAYYEDIELTPDGKITVAGNISYSGGTGGFGGAKPAIARYTSTGVLDPGFGNNGTVVLNTLLNANDMLNALKLQSDGKIVVGGMVGSPFPTAQSYFYLTRLNADGSTDGSFANSGNFITDFNSAETNTVQQIDLQPDGKVLAIGLSRDSTNQYFTAKLCRFTNTILSAEILQESEFAVFPNPATSEVYITTPGPTSELILINALGQLLRQVPITYSDTEIKLDLRGLPPGIYLLNMTCKGEWLVKKIVKI